MKTTPTFCRLNDAKDLYKIAEYKKAALLALKIYRENRAKLAKNANILPFSLCKSHRFKAAAVSCFDLLDKQMVSIREAAAIISTILIEYIPTEIELENALEAASSFVLGSPEIAAIAASFLSEDLSLRFLGWAADKYSLTPRDSLYIEAYIANKRGNPLKAMKLLQAHQGMGETDREAALLTASILNENSYLSEARRYCCLILKTNPYDTGALNLLGQILYQESRWLAAKRIYARCHMLTKDCISLLNADFTLPRLASSSGELTYALNEFTIKLKSFPEVKDLKSIEESLRLCNPLCHSFYLAYQGSIQLRVYFEDYYNIIRIVIKSMLDKVHAAYSCDPAEHSCRVQKSTIPRHISSSQLKIRIGFISRHFFNHSNLQAHAGLIKNLDKNHFEIILIHRHGTRRDVSHESLNSWSDEVIYLGNDYAESCKKISSLSPDVLFFTDIGMYPLDCALAMVQSAPIQVTSWGSPHTSGLREVNYHLRSSIFHDCESAEEYTEKLVSLDGYLGFFEIDRSLLVEKPRDYYLLPPDRFLIGCLQSLHKIHPEFDSYLDEICKIDPSIMIVVAASENDALNHRFARRLQARAPAAFRQICFVKQMGLSDYYSLNQNFDLNLDPIHYGAGITFVQSAWCGPPCVTQRGSTVRSSVVSRSYEYAQINNAPIASNKGEYVSIVRELFENKAKLQSLRREIHSKSHGSIYENNAYIKANSSFFLDLFSC